MQAKSKASFLFCDEGNPTRTWLWKAGAQLEACKSVSYGVVGTWEREHAQKKFPKPLWMSEGTGGGGGCGERERITGTGRTSFHFIQTVECRSFFSCLSLKGFAVKESIMILVKDILLRWTITNSRIFPITDEPLSDRTVVCLFMSDKTSYT